MGRVLAVVLVLVAAAVLPASASAKGGALKAGVAEVDASWHVGAGAGQHASTGTFVDQHGFDPSVHSYHFQRSYGLHSRLKVRALVVEGPDGNRVALVKNDLYIPQDLLVRRVAQILEARKKSGITRETLTMAVTHNHSSPYYSTPSWGVWTFQDFFDLRFFNYYATRMARAVEKAAAALRPVRVGATVKTLSAAHRNVPGRATADDGTPAGFPEGFGDHELAAVRFDDISKGKPRPYAILANYALHPEMLNGNNLISADYVGALERMVGRATGAMLIWTQGAVGNHEPENSAWHNRAERLEFYRRDYSQSERGARLVADHVIGAFQEVGAGNAAVPFQTGSKVAMEDRWFPGPISHPFPSVAGCRTDKVLEGDPRIVVPPECQGADHGGTQNSPFDPGLSTDTLQEQGIPVPENLSVPSFTGLQENISVHLQAFRIGDILFTVCSCEQWADQSLNIKSRTNREQGDLHNGYDWSDQCTKRADGNYDCPQARSGDPVTEHEFQRMKAQVNNDAAGWNDPEYAPYAESEPTDPKQIKGNYTHTELPPEQGYALTVPIGMANDYAGYIVTYREYQRGDHYRKSLNAWGPHASDYMATRLVQMGGQLKGGEAPPSELTDPKTAVDMPHNDAKAAALGQTGSALVRAYERTLPDDTGAGAAVEQPEDRIERFDAATFTWKGGSNWTDLPNVKVQRRTASGWTKFADQSGEVPTTVKFPALNEAGDWIRGRAWEWTAHFEAFASDIDAGSGRATPAGTYRFVVRGKHRENRAVKGYRVVSEPFEVAPWSGITVDDLRAEPDGRVSFAVGPRNTYAVPASQGGGSDVVGPIDYPDTYDVSRKAPYIRHERTAFRDARFGGDPQKVTWFCFVCSFRPWLDAGDADSAVVTVRTAKGKEKTAAAHREGDRWITDYALQPGESALVERGGVRDAFGNFNGAATQPVDAPA